MPNFRYSGWDGTQQIMPFDADAIMEAISEDILAHGDVRRALEKLMQQGYKFQTGEKMPGLRDLLERLKQQRNDTLRRNNMDSVVKDIQQRLENIKKTASKLSRPARGRKARMSKGSRGSKARPGTPIK